YLDIINVYSISYKRKLRGEHEIVYQFNYENGKFRKLLLKSIATTNILNIDGLVSSQESYAHQFSYYDDVSSGMFSSPKSISSPKDLSQPLSMLSGSIDENIPTGDVDLGVGLFFTGAISTMNPLSYGGTFNVSYAFPITTVSEPIVQLIDIDGDGLPDKVVKTSNGFKYRKNIGGNLFSSNLIDIINFDQLSSTRTISKSDLTPSISGFGISKSWSSGKTLSETNIFLTDANADGLIDYVKNKKVYFNRIDPNSGLPTFTTNSLETPNVIYKEGEVDNSVLNELPDLSLGNDLMDVVKVWVAPKNGTINISGTISKNFIGIENGIRYSIEKSTNTIYKNNINY